MVLVTAGAAVAMWDTLQRSISVVIAAAPVLAPKSASAARHARVTCGSARAYSFVAAMQMLSMRGKWSNCS